MASKIKVDQIAESTSSANITFQNDVIVPTGKTITIADGVPVASGGTGLASFAAGDVLYATGATTLAKLAKGTAEQVLAMNAGATAPEWVTSSSGLTLVAEVSTSSGNNKNFGSIPSGVKEIHIMANDCSTNGVGYIGVQIGDAGGIETSGYNSIVGEALQTATATWHRSDMFIFDSPLVAADLYSGTMHLHLQNASTNLWTMTASMSSDTSSNKQVCVSAGRKALSGELTQLNFYTNDTNFDSGAVSISYA